MSTISPNGSGFSIASQALGNVFDEAEEAASLTPQNPSENPSQDALSSFTYSVGDRSYAVKGEGITEVADKNSQGPVVDVGGLKTLAPAAQLSEILVHLHQDTSGRFPYNPELIVAMNPNYQQSFLIPTRSLEVGQDGLATLLEDVNVEITYASIKADPKLRPDDTHCTNFDGCPAILEKGTTVVYLPASSNAGKQESSTFASAGNPLVDQI